VSLIGARTSSRTIGLARIGVAFAALLEARPSAEALLRLTDPGVLHAPYFSWEPAVSAGMAWALIGLWIVSGAAFLIGWRTRLAGVVLAATLAAVLLLDQQLYSNHLYLMVLLVGLLTVADAGAAISLDARRVGTREQVATWPVVLVRLQVSIVYGFAALAKLNLTFLSGSVIAASLRREGLLAVPDGWRSAEPMLVLALLAICLEAFVAVALWSPRWRSTGFVAGLALHGGITGWLSPTYQLLVFSLVMLPLYLTFLDTAPSSLVVVWDDGCGFCAAWVRWFVRLDWLRVLRFVPRSQLAGSGIPVSEEAAAAALQLVDEGRVYAGFAAVTRVAEVLPISFLWAPLLRLPPVAAVGERVYGRVAARRLCSLPEARVGRVSPIADGDTAAQGR
jgi:predicted DCC family thiol-disulfide oxidoreductase YuxK